MQVFNQRSNGVPAMASHFTPEEREVLSQMLYAGRPKTEIAQRLGRNRSSIYREIQRNGEASRYCAMEAECKACQRRRHRPRTCKLDRPAVSEYVRLRLVQNWSPDAIAGRAKLDLSQLGQRISHQTIYTWIHRDPTGYWRQFLRRGKRPAPDGRGKLPRTAAIAGRPAIVDRRERLGDWEGDTIVGAKRRGGMLSLVDRKSGYLLLAKVSDLRASTVRRASHRKLGRQPAEVRHTLTLDNGKEFAEHERLAKRLGLSVYFADPYCPWQRGTNENTNGLVRQYFPKGTFFADSSHHQVACVERLLNERPRKRLGYRTPSEVFHTAHVAIET